MKLREITEDDLEQKNIIYRRLGRGFISTSNQGSNSSIKFKRVAIKRNKKIQSEFYGELVIFEGDIKIILPLSGVMEDYNEDLGYQLKKGLYFMGRENVIISNPRKIKYSPEIMLDIEFQTY